MSHHAASVGLPRDDLKVEALVDACAGLAQPAEAFPQSLGRERWRRVVLDQDYLVIGRWVGPPLRTNRSFMR